MSTGTISQPLTRSLADPRFREKLHQLRQTDNFRNWLYLLRTYAVIAAAIGGAVWFYGFRAAADISFFWNVPVTLLAMASVGAAQHQLGTLVHEAVHHTLFRNRHLNDLVSDWLCSFPIFSSTYHYGLHHLAHHQFVNDPARDPDISQMQFSGHRLSFPILKQEFVEVLLRQLWLPNLFRYSLARVKYDSLGTEHSPYLREDWEFSKVPERIGLCFLAVLIVALTGLTMHGDPTLMMAVPPFLWLAAVGALAALPERCFYQSKIRPLYSVRMLWIMRVTFFTALFGALAWGRWATGQPWKIYFVLLWIVPLITFFPLYMVLRQIVQHGNADRGWLTNTRVFRCNFLVNYAVFPLGQDYHLPHHMFANVPHYRLKQLHEAMREYPEYREHATVVEGYLVPKHRPRKNPTVIDVLGPEHAPARAADVFIDNSVLEERRVEERDKAQLLREGEEEIKRSRVTT